MSARVVGAAMILCLSVVGVACSQALVPTAPGGVTAVATANTASILGAVVDTSGNVIPDVVVAITSTNMVARSDASGRFGLSRIPTGNVELRFIVGSTKSTLELPDVEASEMISLTITLSGHSAIIRASNRHNG